MRSSLGMRIHWLSRSRLGSPLCWSSGAAEFWCPLRYQVWVAYLVQSTMAGWSRANHGSCHSRHSLAGAMLVKTPSSSAFLVSPRNTISAMKMFVWNARPCNPMCASWKARYWQSPRLRRASLQKAHVMSGVAMQTPSRRDDPLLKLVVGFLPSIGNRLMCNKNSLENLVHMRSNLDSVIQEHRHAFSQAQLDVLLMQSMSPPPVGIQSDSNLKWSASAPDAASCHGTVQSALPYRSLRKGRGSLGRSLHLIGLCNPCSWVSPPFLAWCFSLQSLSLLQIDEMAVISWKWICIVSSMFCPFFQDVLGEILHALEIFRNATHWDPLTVSLGIWVLVCCMSCPFFHAVSIRSGLVKLSCALQSTGMR